MHVKSLSIANLAFGQYLQTNWQMSKGFDGRVLEEGGGANTDMLWLLSALSSLLPKYFKLKKYVYV